MSIKNDWPFKADYACTCRNCKNQFAGPKQAQKCWLCQTVVEMAQNRETYTGVKSKVWGCTIGPVPENALVQGADAWMRKALEEVIKEKTGVLAGDIEIFSGWGDRFTVSQQATLHNMAPDPQKVVDEVIEDLKEKGILSDVISRLIEQDHIRLSVSIGSANI